MTQNNRAIELANAIAGNADLAEYVSAEHAAEELAALVLQGDHEGQLSSAGGGDSVPSPGTQEGELCVPKWLHVEDDGSVAVDLAGATPAEAVRRVITAQLWREGWRPPLR
jgi:hypothetical protein